MEGGDSVQVAGTAVAIHGLRSAAAQRLNGQTGRILSRDAATGRYSVLLDSDGTGKLIQGTNMNAVVPADVASSSGAVLRDLVAHPRFLEMWKRRWNKGF